MSNPFSHLARALSLSFSLFIAHSLSRFWPWYQAKIMYLGLGGPFMSPSSLCLSSKWFWRAAGKSKLSRQRGQMNPSWGESPFWPFWVVRVGESVTDFALSAMFFRKFMFAEDQEIIPYLEVRMSLQLGVVGLRPLVLFTFTAKWQEEGGSWGEYLVEQRRRQVAGNQLEVGMKVKRLLRKWSSL